MPTSPTRRAFLELHIAVLLYGFTAILGDWITLSAVVLVWWRVFLVTITLLFVVRAARLLRRLPRALLLRYAGIGVLIALHWVCFYGSIKLANASVSLVTMATTSFFTAFLEPLLLRRRVDAVEIALGLVVVPAMLLISRGMDAGMYAGLFVGFLSAFLAALFGVLNKRYVERADPLEITWLELGSAWLFLSLVLPLLWASGTVTEFWPQSGDWLLLLVLALFCTVLAFWLNLRALQHLSAFVTNLTINLEPVYGLVLAAVLLREYEQLGGEFYLGGLLILGAVVFASLRTRPA